MRIMLLAAAAIAVSAFPSASEAGHVSGSGIPDAKTSVGTLPPSIGQLSGPSIDEGLRGCFSGGRFGDGHRGSRHGRADLCEQGFAGGWAWYGGSTYDDRDWAPDSGNDWWHDRPDRAFPRWMSHNEDCARQWYAGDTLSC